MKKVVIFILVLITVFPAYSQSEKKEKKDDKAVKKQIADGFDAIKWGTPLTGAKNSIRGKLFYTDDKEVIISRDGELEYKYGFFFDGKANEGKFFYLSINFPYLAFKDVKDKYEAKYGAPTSENINNNQGAIAWDSEKTVIIMRVDRYEKKPYSKRILFISKEIVREVNEFQTSLFNKSEIETLKKLNP